MTHYDKKEDISEPIAIGAGWKPGHSTDYDAIMFAKLYESDTIINLSDVPYVYDRDPNKYSYAKHFIELNWNQYRKIVGSEWTPGDNLPFDTIASKEAQESKLKVIVMNGHKLENFENYLEVKSFEGTTIYKL